jgi:serine/threonine protein kinase
MGASDETQPLESLAQLRERRLAPLSAEEEQALAALEAGLFGSTRGPTTLARYVLEERLGQGAHGIVYRAHDPGLDRKVAIKLLRPDAYRGADPSEARSWLVREAQALAKVSHPNIVTVHDVGEYEIAPHAGLGVFVVMELVDGPTLAQWLAQPQEPAEVLRHFLAAGRGLAAAHAAGLVHRDFKPHNVLLGSDGRARVVDFGLAVPTRGGKVTADGSEVAGTPRYMAPEQHAGAEIDARSDQFAFCVALFEGLYRERAFEGEDAEALAEAKRSHPPRVPRNAGPPGLFAALARGLAFDARDRHRDMDTLLDVLARQSEQLVSPASASDSHALSPVAVRVQQALSTVLGKHTAARALALACRRAGKLPGALDLADLDVVVRTLAPMLRTLAGRQVATRVLAAITEQP